MREKDIKKIFDTYCGSSEKSGKAEVSSERVKASVLEKIGMSAAESFYTDSQGEEPVKPIFVAVTKKKRDGAAIKIAAWAGAAACLVAVVMSMGLFGGNGLKTLLPQEVDENNIKPLESVAETSQNVNMDLFDGDRVFRLPLMDGMIFTYSGNEEFNYDHSEIEWFDVVPFLYEKDNRLYFAALNDSWGIVDITDKIGREDFYLYSYENPNNNINTTHYLLIGGDVSEGKYGYMEIFKVKNSTNTWGFVGGFSYEYVSGNKFCDPVDPDAEWLVNGINYLNEKYSIATDPTKNNVGCCRLNVNFKYKNDYKYGDIRHCLKNKSCTKS
ncbi:MAG: hypothetical protein K2J79_06985 [Ruminiclostridium sp.]|nr:hypothetical protein [Ruminiclostridium sp.]